MAIIGIVEDNKKIRDLIQRYLDMQKDMECAVAVDSVEEMLDYLEKHQKPDVILMDIRLNGSMDGIEATQEILANLDSTRVIYVTGNTDNAYKERAEKTGYDAYLIKPLRMEDLKSII